MSIEFWRKLKAELTGGSSEDAQPADLIHDRKFATVRGVALPISFLEFSVVFGPGELANWFRIAVPCNPQLGRFSNLELFDKESPSHYPESAILELYGERPAPLIRRMLYFASDTRNDLFGWDPFPVAGSDEFQIYEVDRSSVPDDLPIPIANSFREFVDEYCLGSGYLQRHENAWTAVPRRNFRPDRR